MLPNFLILGGPRCGSTWLARMLDTHPQVKLIHPGVEYSTGDVHFFDASKQEGRDNRAKGESWYRDLFKDCTGHTRIGEKTADYLADPLAPALIRETLGSDIRLIACLRDPVVRAYSHYWHEKPNLPLGMDFEQAFFDPALNQSVWLQRSGLYHENLCRYRDLFSPDELLVVISEQMWAEPAAQLARICRFLAIDPEFYFSDAHRIVNRRINSGPAYLFSLAGGWLRRHSPRLFAGLRDSRLMQGARSWLGSARGIPHAGKSDQTPMPAAKEPSEKVLPERLQSRLREFYRDDAERLGDMLGHDLTALWWQEIR